MATYKVKDEKSGREITFEWEGDQEPTEKDMQEIFAAATDQLKPSHKRKKFIESDPGDFIGMLASENRDVLNPQTASNIYRPILEGTGGMAGLLATSPSGPGAILGTGLGYGIGKGTADLIDMLVGIKKPYQSAKESFLTSAKDVAMGSTFEITGQAAPIAIKEGSKLAGKVIRPALGRLSGVGTGAINEAINSSQMFKKALRGKISPDEIVLNAKNALNKLIANRSNKYRTSLANISKQQGDIGLTPITKKLNSLMKEYNVKITMGSKGLEIDTSRVAMGQKGRKDIIAIIEELSGWGTKQGDATAIGLDTLKRHLDDFYSESSQARAFVKSLKDTVKDTIINAVPEYKKMLKEYSEATTLIKDIESGLMLRKKGMSGRIVADQTLRRLMSSMRDNFALRKELVETLGNKASIDLSGQIAGYTMQTPIPVGLAGTGPLLAGQVGYAMINPKFWPVIAASSPRVQAEFLTKFGKIMQTYQATSQLMKSEGLKQYLIGKRRKEIGE